MGVFKKKTSKELDIESLNEVIGLGKRILSISFTMIVIALILLVLYIIKMLNLFGIIKDFLIVISPVFIGLIIAWLFDPVADFFESKKLPRIVGCIIVYIILLGVLGLLIFLMIPSFVDQIKDFAGTIPSLLTELKDFVSNTLRSFSDGTDMDMTPVKQQIFASLESVGTGLTTNLPNKIVSFGKGIFSGGMFVVLGLMIGFYMLYDFDRLHMGILDLVPKKYYDDTVDLLARINHSLREYVMGVLIVMTLVFVTQSICLTLAGLEAPLIFALFCAVTDIIPYFGPYIGAIPAVIVGFTISPFTGVCTVIAIVVVQLLENNFYQPLIMGHAMKLHPVTIMLGLLIFEHFFGILGMIVATPVIATIKVILKFVDEKIEVMQKIKDN